MVTFNKYSFFSFLFNKTCQRGLEHADRIPCRELRADDLL